MRGPVIFICAAAIAGWLVGMALGLTHWPAIFTTAIGMAVKVALLAVAIFMFVMDARGSARHSIAVREARQRAMEDHIKNVKD